MINFIWTDTIKIYNIEQYRKMYKKYIYIVLGAWLRSPYYY